MPISKQHKCLFIHIPKTGGTSIESALGIFGDWRVENKEILFGLIQSEELLNFKFESNFLQHLTYEQCQYIRPSNYLSFSFVRNPWDKMVSIFANPDNNLVEVAAKQNINLKELSFNSFIEQTEFIKHIHLEQQYKFIYDQERNISVDFIGRFETIHSDFDKLSRIINTNLVLPHKNESIHRNYKEYYSTRTKKIITKRYQNDIELFQYQY